MKSEKDKVFGKYFEEKSYQVDTKFVLRNMDKRYDKLCQKIHNSKIVQGVSAAVYGITAVALAGRSDFLDEIGSNTFFDEPFTPIGFCICGVTAAAFFLAHKAQNNNEIKADRLAGVYNHFVDKLDESEAITTEMEESGALRASILNEDSHGQDFISKVSEYGEKLGTKEDSLNKDDLSDIDVPEFMKFSQNQDDGQGQ